MIIYHALAENGKSENVTHINMGIFVFPSLPLLSFDPNAIFGTFSCYKAWYKSLPITYWYCFQGKMCELTFLHEMKPEGETFLVRVEIALMMFNYILA